jgi:prepilin-type N-terminal cleavage/methylation domain-containing protein
MINDRRGFTLIELLVATLLFAIIIGAIASFQSVMLRYGSRQQARTLVDGTAAMIAHSLRIPLSEASHITAPTPGSSGTTLQVWWNVNPEDGRSRIITAKPSRFAHFCVVGGQLFLYRGEGVPPRNIYCGSDQKGARIILGGTVDGKVKVSPLFYRPPGENNVLQVQYSVDLAGDTRRLPISVYRQTQFNLRGRMQ